MNKELAEEYFKETGVHLCNDNAFDDYIIWLQNKIKLLENKVENLELYILELVKDLDKIEGRI